MRRRSLFASFAALVALTAACGAEPPERVEALAPAASGPGTAETSNDEPATTTTAPAITEPQQTLPPEPPSEASTTPGQRPDPDPDDEPTTTLGPEPESSPRSTTMSGEYLPWEDHPAARLVPSAELFGAGWERSSVWTTPGADADASDRIEGCPVEPPSVPGIIEASFENGTDEIQLVLAIDDVERSSDMIRALREVADCGPATVDYQYYDLVEVASTADEMLAIAIGIDEGFGDEQGLQLRGHIVLGLYGDALVGVFHVGTAGEIPVDQVVAWADQLAASR